MSKPLGSMPGSAHTHETQSLRKRNPADATGRNIRAAHKRTDAVAARLHRLEKAVEAIAHALHFSNGVKFDQDEFRRALDAQDGE